MGVFSAFLLVVASCSGNEEPKKEETKQEQGSQDIKQNKELTKQVKEEEGVFLTVKYILKMAWQLEKKVSDKDAKKLAEKYAEELKDEYKDLKVNVQAVRDGKNVANITKE